MVELDSLTVLTALVKAHDVVHPQTGHREPILFIKWMGGGGLQHHGFQGAPPEVDEALLEEMSYSGLVDIDYQQSSLGVRPSAEGRRVVAEHERISAPSPDADLGELMAAIAAQDEAESKLGWPAVRPVLLQLRRYWEAAGFPAHGVRLLPVFNDVVPEHEGLTIATIRTLIANDYLETRSELSLHEGRVPAEVLFTDRAFQALDGWPGATPADLGENLLAVLVAEAQDEPNEARKRRLTRVAETVRELGVSTAGEVLSKVILGAA